MGQFTYVLVPCHLCLANTSVIKRDCEIVQLTRITKKRGALAHDDRLDALAIGVQFFTDALEKDSEIGASEMLEDFLMQHLENPLVGFDDHREMMMGDVTMSFEADGTTSNYMGW